MAWAGTAASPVRPSPDPAPGTAPKWAARPPTRREPALNSSSTHRSTRPSASSYRARHSAVESVLRRGTVEEEGEEGEAGVGVVPVVSTRATAGP